MYAYSRVVEVLRQSELCTDIEFIVERYGYPGLRSRYHLIVHDTRLEEVETFMPVISHPDYLLGFK